MAFFIISNDNARIGDESASTTLGPYQTRSQALTAAQRVIDQSLLQVLQPAMLAEDLLDAFRLSGKTAWIIANAGGVPPTSFSPWICARQRCAELCAVVPAGQE